MMATLIRKAPPSDPPTIPPTTPDDRPPTLRDVETLDVAMLLVPAGIPETEDFVVAIIVRELTLTSILALEAVASMSEVSTEDATEKDGWEIVVLEAAAGDTVDGDEGEVVVLKDVD